MLFVIWHFRLFQCPSQHQPEISSSLSSTAPLVMVKNSNTPLWLFSSCLMFSDLCSFSGLNLPVLPIRASSFPMKETLFSSSWDVLTRQKQPQTWTLLCSEVHKAWLTHHYNQMTIIGPLYRCILIKLCCCAPCWNLLGWSEGANLSHIFVQNNFSLVSWLLCVSKQNKKWGPGCRWSQSKMDGLSCPYAQQR